MVGIPFKLSLVLASVLVAFAPARVWAQTLAEQVLERVNLERWDNGQLPPLKGQAQLDSAALLHSTNMGVRNFFMHCDPDTLTQFGARMSAAGYAWNAAAENIAAGQSSAAGVMTAWMNSTGHRTNILATNVNEIGIGYYFDPVDTAPKRHTTVSSCTPNNTLAGNFAHYWTQNFGRRSDVYPVVIGREAWLTTQCQIDVYVYGAGFASQMRFSNNAGATWSNWQAYSPDALWNLSGANGSVATVTAQIRSGGGAIRTATDSIRLGTDCSGGANRVFAHGFEG